MRSLLLAAPLLAFSACTFPEDVPPDPRDVDAGPPLITEHVLTTSDDVSIDSTLYTPDDVLAAPAVLLLHQYQRDKAQWGDFPDELASRGYVVLAISLRGHGESDGYAGDLSGVLTDPDGAPRDVDAGIAFLREQTAVDGDRVAILGTSIGANLAVAAAVDNKAKTYISVSSRREPSEALADASITELESVFFLAGRNDAGGQAADAEAMHALTTAPRGLHIYEDTSAHGIAFFGDMFGADITARVYTWLDENL